MRILCFRLWRGRGPTGRGGAAWGASRVAALCAALCAARCAVLCAALCAALCACTPSVVADPFAYADAPFTVSLRGTYTPAGGEATKVAVAVVYGPVAEGGPPSAGGMRRDLTLTFSEPTSLAGLTVTVTHDQGGTRTVTLTYPSSYGTITASDPAAFDGYLRFAEALLPAGDEINRSPLSPDGCFTVTRRRASDGREARFTFSTTSDSPFPLVVRVTDPSGTLELTVTPGENARGFAP